MQSSKFNSTSRNTGARSGNPTAAPTNQRQLEGARNLPPVAQRYINQQSLSARVRGSPAERIQSRSRRENEDVITLSSDEDDVLVYDTGTGSRFPNSFHTNRRRLGESRNLMPVAQRLMNLDPHSARSRGPPAKRMQLERTRGNEEVITLSSDSDSDEDDILDDFGMEIEEVKAEDSDIEIEIPVVQPLKKTNQAPVESSENGLQKLRSNVSATESKQKENAPFEPKDLSSGLKDVPQNMANSGQKLREESSKNDYTRKVSIKQELIEEVILSDPVSEPPTSSSSTTTAGKPVKIENLSSAPKHQTEPLVVPDKSIPTKNNELIRKNIEKNVTFEIEGIPEIKKDSFSVTEDQEPNLSTSSEKPVSPSSSDLKEVKKLNSLTQIGNDTQFHNTETEQQEGPSTVQNSVETSDKTGLEIGSKKTKTGTNVKVEKKGRSGIKTAKTPAYEQQESKPSSSSVSTCWPIPHTLPEFMSKKINIGEEYQAVVPDVEDFVGREELEEQIWKPREAVTGNTPQEEARRVAEEDMFYKRTHTAYWFAIYRQFKGHIPYELALQNLMNSEYQMDVGLETVDRYLERLPEKLKPLCVAQAKLLASLALKEATTMEEMQSVAMRNYKLVDVRKYYFLFIKYAILIGGHKVPCVCDHDICRPIDFQPRVSCTNCTKSRRTPNGKKSLCLICKTYEEITGVTRPATRVIFSNEEAKFLEAWKEREEALGKPQSKEQIDQMLKREKTTKWKQLDLSDEEKLMLKEKHYNTIGLSNAQIARKKADICNQLKPFVLPLFVDCECLKHKGVLIRERPIWNKKQNLINPEIPGAELIFKKVDDPWFDSSQPMPPRRSLRLDNQ